MTTSYGVGNTDPIEDRSGVNEVVEEGEAGLLKEETGNPMDHIDLPIVGSAEDTSSTAPRYGYEVPCVSDSGNSKRK